MLTEFSNLLSKLTKSNWIDFLPVFFFFFVGFSTFRFIFALLSHLKQNFQMYQATVTLKTDASEVLFGSSLNNWQVSSFATKLLK
jgi:hypothetical protein